MATNSFTGVSVKKVSSEVITKLYAEKNIKLSESDYPNSFIVFKSETASALTRVDSTGKQANLISDKIKAGKIKPRNKEQYMALDMLLDDSVPVNVITGKAGSGKTLLTLATALEKVEDGKYKRIILTRPMSQVGKYSLGSLPGTVEEKFLPYLANFQTNLTQLGGRDLVGLMARYDIECLPMQLIRGASFMDTFIIADEVQVLDESEMLTLGTRVGEGSKIVILGDLDQRDEKIAKTSTGLYKLMNNTLCKESPLVAAIELLKSERSATAALFSQIFESK